ncbi:TPA: flagella biosynthesis regulator Flk, partial [Salmonella enterica]|nr:flagella biosynthesis regulator Flk [Salmonella enterica subsp. enterica serovar Kentucky]
LKNVLTLLQQGQLSIPQPQQRPATDRPLLPAEHNTLNQLVTKLAAATGESNKLIWQSMLELSGVKSGELIPAKQFTHLATWLQARQTLSLQHAPTLHTLQAALKQPLEPDELTAIKEYAQHTYQIQPQTVLTTAQVQDLLNHIFLRRVEREADELEPLSIQPIYRPFAPMIETVKNLSARPGLLFIALIIVLALFWLVS